MGDFSDILFARPSFADGMARVLDLGGMLDEYNTSLTVTQADAVALGADVAAIAQDMYTAIEAVAEEHGVTLAETAPITTHSKTGVTA